MVQPWWVAGLVVPGLIMPMLRGGGGKKGGAGKEAPKVLALSLSRSCRVPLSRVGGAGGAGGKEGAAKRPHIAIAICAG